MRPRLFALLAFLPAFVSAQQAASPDVAPAEEELRRFVVAYRATDAPIAMLRYAAQAEAERGPSMQADYLRCVSAAVSPEALTTEILPILREEFRSSQRLGVLIAFFESRTGQKALDQVAATLPRSRVVGQMLEGPKLQPQDFSLTDAEREELHSFEQQPAYREFQSFVRRVNSPRPQSDPDSALGRIQESCRREVLQGRTR